VITAIVGAVLVALIFAVVIALAKDKGPGPDDAAVAYELAWDRLDFESLFTLSARELRDGRDRQAFVAAKRAAYEHQQALGGLVARVGIDEVATGRDAAVVLTAVELRDGSIVHNRIELIRRNARWEVAAYSLTPSEEKTPGTSG
jgi:hypothetical protein